MSEERFDELIREAARAAYHPPPEPPREAMWARIEEARRYRRRDATRPTAFPGWRWGLSMAAVLAIGVGIGQWLERRDPVRFAADPPEAAGTGAETSMLPYRVAAVQHLSQMETLLTSYRSRSRTGHPDGELGAWARDLLTGTRLLLDSPAAEDPQLHALLQDLELVLVQIAQLSTRREDQELDLIDQALEQHDVLARLRAAVPAGPAVIGT